MNVGMEAMKGQPASAAQTVFASFISENKAKADGIVAKVLDLFQDFAEIGKL